MDYFNSLKRQVGLRLFLLFWLAGGGTAAAIWLAGLYLGSSWPWYVGAALAASAVLAAVFSNIASGWLLSPVRSLWQAVLHVSPSSHSIKAPDLDGLGIGRQLVTSLAHQVYELARQTDASPSKHTPTKPDDNSLANNLPIAILVCDGKRQLSFANKLATNYCALPASAVGTPVFNHLNLQFASNSTLESWMDECQKDKIHDLKNWERVRISLPDHPEPLQCDLAASFNRDNPDGSEFVITLFDRTEAYRRDDNSLGFVALAVHELRTPLTMLRGYIEVFEEELSGQLDDELKGFMSKMRVAAEQLTSFVNNILNVTRIEDDQLELRLAEEDWIDLIHQIVNDNQLRAKVHDKLIKLSAPASLPKVAVDRVSIYEVVSNLIDNAIKYSAESKEIDVKVSLTKDGLVETTVTDHGVGIASGILPNLFEKFYRNHRTRNTVGGTGLGLYLSKAIITAHGGQIWASSKEGQGSTFGFNLQPYDKVAHELKGNHHNLTRTAHGWVVNHSLYRR